MAALVACTDDSKKLARSGSGFVLDAERGLVVTSASWLEGVIALELDASPIANVSLKWRFKPAGPLAFTVTANTHAREPVLCSACVSDIRCLPSVHANLTNVFVGPKDRATTTPTSNPRHLHCDLVLLSSLVILKLTIPPSCRLEQLACMPCEMHTGLTVRLVGTPFGTLCPPVFFNSVSEGCVCKAIPGGGGLFVTDARCPQGCEGGVVITNDNGSRAVVGVVLCPFSAPDGFPSGLTLCCSMATMGDILREYAPLAIPPDHLAMAANPPRGLAKRLSNTVVGIIQGSSWGTGIFLSPDVVLTCGHIVNGARATPTCTSNGLSDVTILAPPSSSSLSSSSSSSSSSAWTSYRASVMYTNGRNVPDVALLRVELLSPAKHPIGRCYLKSGARCASHPEEGGRVFAIGYGLESPANTGAVQPLCTRGVVSKVVCHHGNPRLIQTTSSVLPGMSGGLVCTEEGEGVGMIVSNSREDASGWVYPDINYCLPFSWILPHIQRFLSTRDNAHMREMESCGPEVTGLWTLQKRETESERKSKL